MSGWIKIHRKIWEWGYSNNPDYLSVWIYLLSKASHTNYDFSVNGQKITLQSGQLLTGRKAISKETGVSESKVFRILKRLEIEQQIKQQHSNKYTIISITNWGDYQSNEQENEQQMNNKRTTDEQQMNTNKNDNNKKNVKNDKKSIYNINISIPKNIYQEILTDPLLCNGDRNFLLHCCNEMQDWSVSKGEKRIDWSAALRNWIRRAKKDRSYKPKEKSLLEIAEELDRQDAEALAQKKDLIN